MFKPYSIIPMKVRLWISLKRLDTVTRPNNLQEERRNQPVANLLRLDEK